MRRVTRGSILRYRFMAYFTGVMLLLLCVAVYMKYGAPKNPKPVEIFGAIHGYGYLVYLVVAADLAWRARWSLLKTGLVLLAGTIPFMSFVAERFVARDLTPDAPAADAAPVSAGDPS